MSEHIHVWEGYGILEPEGFACQGCSERRDDDPRCEASLEIQQGRTATSVRCARDYGHASDIHKGQSGTAWIARRHGHGQCGCCDSASYIESLLTMLHADGPDKIGQAEFDLVCKLIDELGK